MAAQGMDQRIGRTATNASAFWLAAVLATGLSLAAALVGLHYRGGGPIVPSQGATALQQAEARQQRIAFFEARAAADPIDVTSLNVLAGEYLQRARETGDVSDYQRADFAATKSVSIVPNDNYTGIFYLAAVKLASHDYAAVVDLANRDIALKPGSAPAYGALGDGLVGLGRYDEARQAFEKMVAIDPTLPSLSRLANLSLITGDSFNAADYWKQSATRAEGLPAENLAWVHTQLGLTYQNRGELKSAETELTQALNIYPGYVHALAGMGALAAAKGRWQESIDYYTRAVDKLPQPLYVAALGDSYAFAGNRSGAQTQYDLVEAIDRLYQANGINTDMQLALFYADHDVELPRALTMAQSAYAEAPNVYAADVLAWSLYKNQRYAEANTMAATALARGTQDASFYYHAGLIRLALDDREGARAFLQKAIGINPTYVYFKTDLAKQTFAELNLKVSR